MSRKKISKRELLRAIRQLEKNPHDRVKILSEVGITGIGVVAGGGAAALLGASTASIPVVTALTGVGIAVAAPVALVAGAAVAGGLATYGVVKLATGGAAQEAKRKELKRRLEEQLRDLETQKRQEQLTISDKNDFILFLRMPLEQNLIKADQAQQLIEMIEAGQISLQEAYQLLNDILDEGNGNSSALIRA